jgi:hypothetical protein
VLVASVPVVSLLALLQPNMMRMSDKDFRNFICCEFEMPNVDKGSQS